MLDNLKLVQEMAARSGEKGVYVAPFSVPVMPRWQNQTHLQISAVCSREALDRTIEAFIDVGRQLEIIE